MDAAEGEVGRFPHLHARVVRRKYGPSDAVSPHKIQRPVFDHPDDHPARPDVLPEHRAVVLRGPTVRWVLPFSVNRGLMACFAGICAVGKASDLRRQSVWQLGGDWVG